VLILSRFYGRNVPKKIEDYRRIVEDKVFRTKNLCYTYYNNDRLGVG